MSARGWGLKCGLLRVVSWEHVMLMSRAQVRIRVSRSMKNL